MRSNNVYLNNLYKSFMDGIYEKLDSAPANEFPELIELPIRALKKARDLSLSIETSQQNPHRKLGIYSLV